MSLAFLAKINELRKAVEDIKRLLEDITKRLEVLESRRGPGRPPKE